MRIAVWHNLPSGGGKRTLYDHVRGLLERGHTLEAWCPPTADREFSPLNSLIKEHVVDLDWPNPSNPFNRLQVERSLAAMDAHCRHCADHINRGGFDVLFANACRFFRTSSIGRHAQLPSILYLGEPFRALYEALPRLMWVAPAAQSRSFTRPSSWKAEAIYWLKLRNSRLQAREEIENARAFRRILVNSYYSRESVLRAYGIESDVCYLGIDTNLFCNYDLVREDYVVGLGSVTPPKNINLVIEAIGTMPEPRPRLVWVGNMAVPEYRAEMIELARERGVALELQVGISDIKVVDILNRALLMVYTPRLEPFGLAPLEAGACEVPVVAVREGGVRETIHHHVNGLFVDSEAAEVARAIARIRDDPEFARELGRNGRRLVTERWSLDTASGRLEELLTRYASPGR